MIFLYMTFYHIRYILSTIVIFIFPCLFFYGIDE